MQARTASELDVVNELARCFYAVVPDRYRTFCSQNARVAQEALRRFGFRWRLLPCQLWYAGRDRNHVVGFVGNVPPGMWDGHVVCANGSWFVEPTLHHLNVAGIEAPGVIVGERFHVPSQAIARHDLRTGERLWWLHPPAGMQTQPPDEPRELVEHFAAALADMMQSRLAGVTASRC